MGIAVFRTKKKNLTVEELYVEVAYTILHMIGCDSDQVTLLALISLADTKLVSKVDIWLVVLHFFHVIGRFTILQWDWLPRLL